MIGLDKDECLAMILHLTEAIRDKIQMQGDSTSGNELQNDFDRINTFVQAVKVL